MKIDQKIGHDENTYMPELLTELQHFYINNLGILEILLNIFLEKSPVLNKKLCDEIIELIDNRNEKLTSFDLYRANETFHNLFIDIRKKWKEIYHHDNMLSSVSTPESQITSLILTTIHLSCDENLKFDCSKFIEKMYKGK